MLESISILIEICTIFVLIVEMKRKNYQQINIFPVEKSEYFFSTRSIAGKAKLRDVAISSPGSYKRK